VVVLAAGASRRLPGPKQLLRYRGVTLLRRAAQTAVAAACGPVVVVLAAGAGPLRFELQDLDVRIVENPDAAQGLSTSVRSGLAALEGHGAPDAVLFMTCDQPEVTPEILGRLVAAFATSHAPAVACEYAGTVGVPALVGRALFDEVRALAGDAGARQILQRHPAETVRVPFEGGALDIDTPEDVRRLT
jgi:molybdenum cofactor cytidylyltransferase